MTNDDAFDALQLQVWTADTSGALTFVNQFTAEYFGKSREQLIGEGWQNVLHSSDLPAAVDRWLKSINSGEPYDVDFRLLRGSDRSYRWHHATARRVTGSKGLQWVGSNVDIDPERRATETMQAWRERTLGRAT